MIKNFTDKDVTDQSGRIFLVTGANTGLGFEAAKVLASNGGRVLLGCRSEKKAATAMDRIRKDAPDADLDFVPLDQASLKSVKAAAKRVNKETKLDVLVNNAGIMGPPLERTEDGFESQFGVNHLGTFALTGLLLPKLEQIEGSRVVITSSLAHRGGRINFDDPNAEGKYSAWERYSMSKLANILHATELARRLEAHKSNTIATCCHPGIANTELARHMPFFAQPLMPLVGLLLNTPAQGAWPTLAAAVDEGAENGGYYGPGGLGEWSGKAGTAARSRKARNEELAEKLWDLSVEMTGVDPGI